MASEWYFGHNGESYGPYSAAQLKELAAAGGIQLEDTVWKGGTEKRVPASRVEHLFADVQRGPVEPAASQTAPAPSGSLPAPPLSPPEPRVLTAVAPPDVLDDISSDAVLLPVDPVPEKKPEVRKKRVLSIKGGDITSQDGVTMKYRKKCPQCGYQDTSASTVAIPTGSLRVNFYCLKCKKNRPVEIQGV